MNRILYADNWLHSTPGLRWIPRALGLCWMVDRHLDDLERAA